MEILYKNGKLEKICMDAKVADKIYGKEMAEKIQMRIDQIRMIFEKQGGRIQIAYITEIVDYH